MLLSAQCKNLFSATQSRDLKVAAPLKGFSVFFGTTYFTKLFHSILISLVYKSIADTGAIVAETEASFMLEEFGALA